MGERVYVPEFTYVRIFKIYSENDEKVKKSEQRYYFVDVDDPKKYQWITWAGRGENKDHI